LQIFPAKWGKSRLGVVGAWENVVGIKQGEKNKDRFNGSPRLCPPLDKERKKKEKILTIPITLPSPAGWRGERRSEGIKKEFT
jgi:hypothetical protein